MTNDPWHNVLEFGFMPGQKVADLGSGSGFYTAALSQAVGPEGRVIAVDIEPVSLSKLKKSALLEGRSNIEVLEGDIEVEKGTHLGDSVLDGAVFSHTFAGLGNKPIAVHEASRIVKRGGKVCFVEKEKTEISSAAMMAGLDFVREFDAGRGQRGIVFKKQ